MTLGHSLCGGPRELATSSLYDTTITELYDTYEDAKESGDMRVLLFIIYFENIFFSFPF